MKVGDQVWVQGENRLGWVRLTIEEHGRLLYVVLYDDVATSEETGEPLPPGESGPVFGIVCAATLLVTLE